MKLNATETDNEFFTSMRAIVPDKKTTSMPEPLVLPVRPNSKPEEAIAPKEDRDHPVLIV